MSAVIEHLRSRREAHLRQLTEYLRMPSISTLNVGVREAAGHLAGLMREAGAEARILPTGGHPVVYGEARGPAGAPVLLVYGHYDVQPAEAGEGWSSPPFEPQVREGRLYARGAGDNKGQHFAQLKALEAFKATGTPLPVTVKFLIEGEEEMGSTHLREFVLQHRALLGADIACSSDGSLHPSRRPTLALGCRGLLYLELIARGAGKDLHSGSYGGAVESPFWRLMQAVQALRGPDGRVRVPGFYDAVRPLGRADQEALAGIPDPASELRAALGEGAERAGDMGAFYTKTLTGPNLNICGFQGGYSGEGMKTVIPGAVRAKVDFRLVVDQDPHKLHEDVCAFLKKEGFGDIEVRKLATFEPSKTPADHPLIQKIIRSIEWEGQKP
ncbi:MAG: M20/M25/M40 family metallo-hydrolase, partial [Candidatus Tectomicrobia bacterium]|nr:M20/M25/M40 family metallo-hydrolase [Candidatus Tectomicrobia bacterium]